MKSVLRGIFCVVLIATGLASCVSTEEVDLVVHNASIFTLNDQNEVFSAMAIRQGRIVEIGPEHQILNKYHADEFLDLRKRPVLPGFVDAASRAHFEYFQNLEREVHDTSWTRLFDQWSSLGYTGITLMDANANYRDQWNRDSIPVRMNLMLHADSLNWQWLNRNGGLPDSLIQLNGLSFMDWSETTTGVFFDSSAEVSIAEIADVLDQMNCWVNLGVHSDSLYKMAQGVYAEVLAEVNDKRWSLTSYSPDRVSPKWLKKHSVLPLIAPVDFRPEKVDWLALWKANHFLAAGSTGMIPQHPMEAYVHLVQAGLDRNESYKALSRYPALLAGWDQCGRLEAGYWADFIITNRDPFNAPLEELTQIEIRRTFVGGKPIYSSSRK
ncbi:amidohydrolase family protein [bacterium SCSIO 12741]|nr:amidohydrolase family protein [bacterium SCSIO 12741]